MCVLWCKKFTYSKLVFRATMREHIHSHISAKFDFEFLLYICYLMLPKICVNLKRCDILRQFSELGDVHTNVKSWNTDIIVISILITISPTSIYIPDQISKKVWTPPMIWSSLWNKMHVYEELWKHATNQKWTMCFCLNSSLEYLGILKCDVVWVPWVCSWFLIFLNIIFNIWKMNTIIC